MKTQKIIHKNVEHKVVLNEVTLSLWAGALSLMGLIGFFMCMQTLGLYQILWLRYFNLIFLGAGILSTFYNYRKNISRNGIEYFTGLKMGGLITLVAVIPFSVFMAIYLKADTVFMTYVKHNAEFGQYLTPAIAAAAIGFEGIVSGVVTTFIVMQYYKRND